MCGRAELPEDARFCPRCGGRLAIEAPAAAGDLVAEGPGAYTPDHLRREVLVTRSALEGERKHVAVLMADVVDSLAMADALDPEDVHALMEGFFEIAIAAVHRHGGTINQFRGDGFMALFGAPRNRGDEALRAARAALEIVAAAGPYGRRVEERHGLPLLLRLGLHAGLVWVGSIGSSLRRDYTAEGATVGLAARLERLAHPGQVLASEFVAREVAGPLRVREVGVHEVRGMREPVRVFEVLAPGEAGPPREPGAEGSADSSPRLFGRGRELARIERQQDALLAESACLVEVRGASGIGKSRLLRELARRAETRGRGLLPGRCLEPDATRALSAWLTLLERAPAWGPLAGPAAGLARDLRSGRLGRDPQRLEEEVRHLLERAGEKQGGPVTLAFDDVQWMDPSSVRLVGQLLERPPDPGMLLVVTCRDESPALWDAPATLRVPLEPLSPRHIRALVRELLEGEEPLVELVVERSGGNPLFALELARSLRDGSHELRSAARAEARLRRSPVRLPASVRGILAARIDSLPDDAKRLLQAASVVGTDFEPDLLRRIQPEEGDPAPILADLVGSGVLVREGDGFSFAHVLAREVAYEQMLLTRRRLLHGRLAEILEADLPVARDPYAASLVGDHFARSGHPLRAAPLLARAGKAYLRSLAVGEAATHLRRAWEILWEEPAERVDVRLRAEVGLDLAEALNARDLSGEASAVLSRLSADDWGELDPLPVAQALVNQGWVRALEDERVVEGQRLLERGLAIAERCPDGKAVVASASAYLTRIHHLEGRIEQAAECARRVAEIATAGGNRFGLVFGRGNEGYVLREAGDVARARALGEEALSLCGDVEDPAARALALAWLARTEAWAGDAEGALRRADQAATVAREAGQVGALYTARMAAGEAHLLRGETRKAAARFDALAELNDRWTSTRVHIALGRLETGRSEEALAIAEACLAGEPALIHRLRLMRILALARAEVAPGRSEPEALLRDALTAADERGLRPHVAAALVGLAELSVRRGDGDAAGYYLDRASTVYASCAMGAHAEAARAQLPNL